LDPWLNVLDEILVYFGKIEQIIKEDFDLTTPIEQIFGFKENEPQLYELKNDNGIEINSFTIFLPITDKALEEFTSFFFKFYVKTEPIVLISSKILNNIQQKRLLKILPSTNCSFKYLHGDMHSLSTIFTDGPTLMIIKNQNGYVFGAYIQETLCTRGNELATNTNSKTFLFTFRKENYPIKICYTSGLSSCSSTHAGRNLVIGDADIQFNYNGKMLTFGAVSFTTIVGHENVPVNAKTLAGSENCTVSEFEVFAVVGNPI